MRSSGDMRQFDYAYTSDLRLKSIQMTGFGNYYSAHAQTASLSTCHLRHFAVSEDRRVSPMHHRDAVVLAPAALPDRRKARTRRAQACAFNPEDIHLACMHRMWAKAATAR